MSSRLSRPVPPNSASSGTFADASASAVRSVAASSALPVRASATPRAKCHHATSTGWSAGGCASARISSWRPKRSSTAVFIVISDSTIGIICVCGASFSATSVAAWRAARQPAAHHLGVGEEVQVVGEVREAVESCRRRRVLKYSRSASGARLVGAGGGGLVADARIDVRGHVGEVAGGRRQRIEPQRARQRAARRRRRLDGVDVVVIGAEVIRIACEHRLEHGDDLVGAFGGLAVERPELPRAEVHQALGVQRGGVEIVRVSARQIAHRVGVLARQRRAVGLRGRSESGSPSPRCTRARPRVRSFDSASALRDRARSPASPARRRHRGCSWGRAPTRCPSAASRAFGSSSAARSNERDRLLVVEAEDQVEPLVEVALRLSVRRCDGMVVIPESGPERHGTVRRLSRWGGRGWGLFVRAAACGQRQGGDQEAGSAAHGRGS